MYKTLAVSNADMVVYRGDVVSDIFGSLMTPFVLCVLMEAIVLA